MLLLLCALSGCARYEAAASARQIALAPHLRMAIDTEAVAAERARLTRQTRSGEEPADRLDLVIAGALGNAEVRAARARLQAAVEARVASGQAPSPSLSLLGERAQHAAESSPWLFGFTFDLPLETRQRRATRIDAADYAVLQARCDLADALWKMRSALRNELTILLANRHRVDALEEIGRLQALRLEVLMRQADAGEIARTAIDQLRLDRGATGRQLRAARQLGMLARYRIATELGVTESALALDEELWPDFFAAAGGEAWSGGAADLAVHPDLQRAIGAYELADSEYRLELARQYPGVSVAPGYTWERGLVKLPVGLNLSLPPFDLNRGAIAAALARRKAAALVLEASFARVESARVEALSTLAQARGNIVILREKELPAAAAQVARADREFSAGAVDRAAWSAARIAAVSTRLAEIDAIEQLRAAQSALEDVLRRPVEGPELEISLS